MDLLDKLKNWQKAQKEKTMAARQGSGGKAADRSKLDKLALADALKTRKEIDEIIKSTNQEIKTIDRLLRLKKAKEDKETEEAERKKKREEAEKLNKELYPTL